MAVRMWLLLATAVAVLGVPSWADARGHGGRVVRGDTSGGDDAPNKRPGFVVIQSGDTEGKVTFEGVPASELDIRKEALPAAYRAAVKRYAGEKQEAKNKGEKLTTLPPDKPFVQRYKEETYSSLKMALRVAEECQKNWDKEFAKKPDKGGDGKAAAEKAGGPAKEQKAVSEGKPGE